MPTSDVNVSKFGILTGFSASRAAASIGKAEFFAPEILTSPVRGVPPRIMSLSTSKIPP